MKIVLERILVPTDFSARSRAAIAYGVAFVEEFGGSLHILHVVEDPVGLGADAVALPLPPRKAVEKGIEATAWKELRDILSKDDYERIHTVLAVQWGVPSVEILRYAKTHAIDLIAMATHRRSGATRLLIGSVAEDVVRKAPARVRPPLVVHSRSHPSERYRWTKVTAIAPSPTADAQRLTDP
jgi:nucleotide-binding universal stress UspA family protein